MDRWGEEGVLLLTGKRLVIIGKYKGNGRVENYDFAAIL